MPYAFGNNNRNYATLAYHPFFTPHTHLCLLSLLNVLEDLSLHSSQILMFVKLSVDVKCTCEAGNCIIFKLITVTNKPGRLVHCLWVISSLHLLSVCFFTSGALVCTAFSETAVVLCVFVAGEGGQGRAAGRGTEPQAEQPAAAGGVSEHSGPPHQSHRAAVQRQQALLAAHLQITLMQNSSGLNKDRLCL